MSSFWGAPIASSPPGKLHERYRLIIFSGAASTAAKILTAFIGLISMPLILNQIGKDLFGLWAIVTSLIVWMQLFDLGIANGLSNALAEANGRNDKTAANNYLSSALIASMAIALVLLPLFSFACFQMPWNRALNIYNNDLNELATQAFLLTGIAFIVNMPVSLICRVFIAYQRGYVCSVAQLVASAFSLAAILVAVHFELGFLWLIGIVSFSPVIVNMALWFSVPKSNTNLRIGINYVSRSGVSRVAASSIPLFVFQCGALLVNQLVNVVIVNTTDLSMVADYNIVLKVYLLIFSIAAGLCSPFYPAIREAFEKQESLWVMRAVRHALISRLFATLLFALPLLVIGDTLIELWIGSALATRIGAWGWLSVFICLILSASSSLFSEILNSLDDIWSQIHVVIASAVTVLGLLTLLTPPLGVTGVFLSMSISTLFPIIWASNRIKTKIRKIRS